MFDDGEAADEVTSSFRAAVQRISTGNVPTLFVVAMLTVTVAMLAAAAVMSALGAPRLMTAAYQAAVMVAPVMTAATSVLAVWQRRTRS